jgi:hypothetical protein
MGKRSDPARPADALAQAINHLARGAWQRAHEIVQQEESPLAAWRVPDQAKLLGAPWLPGLKAKMDAGEWASLSEAEWGFGVSNHVRVHNGAGHCACRSLRHPLSCAAAGLAASVAAE